MNNGKVKNNKMDKKMIKHICSTHDVLISIEEHNSIGGFGSQMRCNVNEFEYIGEKIKETKRLKRFFLRIAMTAFLVLLAGNAFAIDNATRVVSPYWQVDSGSYTFIAVSHSSLSGMNSQIGIKITAVDMSTDGEYGTAQSFTIDAGTTRRIFIDPTSHTTLNPTSLTDSDVSFIRGTSNYSHGSIRIAPVANPVTAKFLELDHGGTTRA